MSEGRRLGGNKAIVAVAAIIIVVIGSLGYFFMWRETGPIPRKYTKGLNFALYYPTRLPGGYTVDTASFEQKEGVLIFSLNAPRGRNVAVSLQATPPDVPPRSTSTAPIKPPGERNFYTAIGQANIGLWGDKYVSDIVTPKGTWIIMNVTGFTTDEATKLSQSFTELE